MMPFCDNKYFPSSWQDGGNRFLSMEFESIYIQHTHGEVNHEDGQVPKPSAWDDNLRRRQHINWCRPVLCQRGDRTKCLHATASSVSPKRLFSSVGLVKSDLWGSLLNTTLIDVIWRVACRFTVPHTLQSLPFWDILTPQNGGLTRV
jgi:hypothetical protein